ncbi:MAG: hypothetical protein AB7O96_17025 [Pseudobdellovibrionaceae bacterium]
MDFSGARFIVIVTVAIYFIFDHFEGKQIQDERENLIRLKTFELMQKLTLWVLSACAVFLIFNPDVPAIYPVMALVASCMYGEIFGRIYYRKKL